MSTSRKYGRPPTTDTAFCEVYEVTPVVLFGFNADETLAPPSTRWTF
jgi:hypothetical protein